MLTTLLPIHRTLETLNVLVGIYVNKMPKFYRDAYGFQIIKLCVELLEYVDLINTEEVLSKRKGLLKTFKHKFHHLRQIFNICFEISHRGIVVIDEKSSLVEDLKDARMVFTNKQMGKISVLLESIGKQSSGWLKTTTEEADKDKNIKLETSCFDKQEFD